MHSRLNRLIERMGLNLLEALKRGGWKEGIHPASVYDSRSWNKGNLNLLCGVVSKGMPWPLGAFENRRSFTSIGNLREVIKGLLTKDAPSGIYHMGADEALSTNELIEVICSALGKKARIWRVPEGLMNGLAKVGDVLHLPLNSLRMQKLTENYVVSNAKIMAALGMARMPVRAKDGLRETIKSFAGK